MHRKKTNALEIPFIEMILLIKLTIHQCQLIFTFMKKKFVGAYVYYICFKYMESQIKTFKRINKLIQQKYTHVFDELTISID